MKNKSIIILFLSLLPVLSGHIYSQDAAKITPYIQLQYFKNTDDQRILQTTLTYSKNRMELPLPGMEISFYTGPDKKELLAKVITDNKGVAGFDLGSMKLKSGNEGVWAFSSEFNGNDTIEKGVSEISVKDLKLGMTLAGTDSIKTVTVNAFTGEGEKRSLYRERQSPFMCRGCSVFCQLVNSPLMTQVLQASISLQIFRVIKRVTLS